MKLTFIGAAQEVTGSCFLVEADGVRFLVDCGMFQGGREARARNLRDWTFDPKKIDFVLLTHAHIDHSGLLPRLSALGFDGPIITTTATADLLSVMLLDSAFIQETDWARAQRKSYQQHKRAAVVPELLYTVAQAQDCLEQLSGVAYDEEIQPHAAVRCRFRDAGHILGSAIIEVWVKEGTKTTKLVFSGDLGQPGRPIVRDPTPIDTADVLIVESTYGNRLHRPLKETIDELVFVIEDTLRRRQGNIIIPAFALGRTQEVLWLLADLCRQGKLPKLQVFVDSPMATKATEITWKHTEFLDDETRALLSLREELPKWLDLRFTQTVEESIALNRIKAGAIIISASGMCDAGRIKHHLSHNIERAECAIVIIGFQAAGTLGRRLVDGEKKVRIFGEEHAVRAKVHTIGGLSAHADQAALLGWLKGFASAPMRTFVVHGEAQTACGFADRVSDELGWSVEAPAPGTRIDF
ncbi:MAG: MBL fold metallo-hydrolase [Polaromonas sp.]|uniref:MBL fold metallo-hydrolase RNA specificity domain-containing protein n=1 Tax=Polaromonas sp. TaxID=1869339 RepID=UPI00272F889D|nr:MBL fold metallo-hydrolase [Polaromonas sp.]MDP2255164.1 MBL fold metallo-hydrolase [Polaromonas sp.]